jgi:hypothetical protein
VRLWGRAGTGTGKEGDRCTFRVFFCLLGRRVGVGVVDAGWPAVHARVLGVD